MLFLLTIASAIIFIIFAIISWSTELAVISSIILISSLVGICLINKFTLNNNVKTTDLEVNPNRPFSLKIVNNKVYCDNGTTRLLMIPISEVKVSTAPNIKPKGQYIEAKYTYPYWAKIVSDFGIYFSRDKFETYYYFELDEKFINFAE